MAGYALVYGIPEAAGRLRPVAPGVQWQVPARWMHRGNAWRRVIIWGVTLGPGFVTINPYAGFWVLVLAVASIRPELTTLVMAGMFGAAHATGRAVALQRDIRRNLAPEPPGATFDPDKILLEYKATFAKSLFWRVIDGYLLLLIGGTAVTACIYRLAG